MTSEETDGSFVVTDMTSVGTDVSFVGVNHITSVGAHLSRGHISPYKTHNNSYRG